MRTNRSGVRPAARARLALQAVAVAGSGAILGCSGLALAAPPAAADPLDLGAAVAALQPGGQLVLPSGVFEVRAPLKLPAGATLRGAGSTTVLRLSRANWDQFHYGFAIVPAPGADGVSVAALTIDGNRTNHSGTGANPPANAGGGIRAGNGWTISGVRLTNINYFPVWVHHVDSVRITGSTFDADRGSTGGKDNIGGGRSSNVEIAGNTFAVTAVGNAVDLVGGHDISITGNRITGTAGREHSVYLEGVRDALVKSNRINHGSIAVSTDASYEGVRRPVNPAGIRIAANTVTNSPAAGITITYSGSETGKRLYRGGGNRITGNDVRASGLSGIAIIHCVESATSSPDQIVNNTVTDSFTRGDATWGTGCGTVAASGITVTAGQGTVITGNAVVATQRASVDFGIYLGAQRARAGLSGTTVDNNSAPAGVTTTGWARER